MQISLNHMIIDYVVVVVGKFKWYRMPYSGKCCNFAPMLGENILEVRRDLGYEDFSIEHLEQEGMVSESRWSLLQT